MQSYKNSVGRITNSDFKCILKHCMVLVENRQVNQCNKIENTKISTGNCRHLMFDIDNKDIYWRKERIFNKRCCKNWMLTCRKIKLDPYSLACTHTNSKWVQRPKYENWNTKTVRRNYTECPPTHICRNALFE